MKECFYNYVTQTSILYNYLDVLQNNICTKCNLGASKPIVYRGNLKADILLVGEGPGKTEEEVGLPFTGVSGQLLDKIFESIDLDTNKDMLLSNCIMCRPKAPEGSGRQNLTPNEEQLDACFPYVRNLIRIIKPKVIIACGRIALGELLGDRKVKMKDYEGKWITYNKEYDLFGPRGEEKITINPNIPMFAMCHPSYILRQKDFMSADEYNNFKLNIKNYMNEFKKGYMKIKNAT